MNDYLKKVRKMRCLTQREVASTAGCSQELVSKAERGLPITVATAKKIAAALEIDWKLLF